MSATQPPRLATWLMQRLASGPRRESLLGDLIEQYHHGRSASWYWRQALTAIVVGVARDIGAHKLLAARALAIGWAVSVLAAFPVNWLSGVIRVWITDWLVEAGQYSLWGVFWAGQLPGNLLVYLAYAASGWIVARLHPAHSAAMVCLYAASVLFFEYGMISYMFLRYGHPPMPQAALIFPAILMAGRPLSILLGGLLGAQQLSSLANRE
jgi:hypothetical protein